jgi:hypothetical protein
MGARAMRRLDLLKSLKENGAQMGSVHSSVGKSGCR